MHSACADNGDFRKKGSTEMVYVFLAEGFEEIEALCPIDLMRRAGIEVTTVSVSGDKQVLGSHNISVEADILMDQLRIDELPELIMLPGGMPGAVNLSEDRRLCELLRSSAASGGRIAAICAAPFILGQLGLLKDREATCYPGYEESLTGARISEKGVVRDGNIITATGMGVAFEFGLELVRALREFEAAEKIADSIRFRAGIKD